MNSPRPRDSKRSNKRRRDHRGGNTLVDRGENGPASLARVRDPAGEVVEIGRAGEGIGDQVDEPRADDRAAAPYLGHLSHVDVVLVGLGVSQWRGLGVDLLTAFARIGVLDDAQSLGDGRHHPVLHAVVDHLDEVPGAVRAAVQIALGRRAVACGSAPGVGAALPIPGAIVLKIGSRRCTTSGLPADHEAVAAIEAPDAATGAAVEIVNPLGCQLLGPR